MPAIVYNTRFDTDYRNSLDDVISETNMESQLPIAAPKLITETKTTEISGPFATKRDKYIFFGILIIGVMLAITKIEQ